jgi:hypothetical protein
MSIARTLGLSGVAGSTIVAGALLGLAHAASSGPTPELTVLQGTWRQCPAAAGSTTTSGDEGDFCLDDVELDLGPVDGRWAAPAAADFDGDGSIEILADEFDGLVGQVVVVEVERDDADADVYVIDGLEYRDPTTDRPSWADGPPATGALRPAPAPDLDRPSTAGSTVAGTWEACGDEYCLDGRVLGLGPPWYRAVTVAADYDGDGDVRSVADELSGLVGVTVTLTVTLDGGTLDVVQIDGEAYRPDPSGPPPWAGGPFGDSASPPSPPPREEG